MSWDSKYKNTSLKGKHCKVGEEEKRTWNP